MDDVGAAIRQIGRLDRRAELALRRSRTNGGGERREPAIRHDRAQPVPAYLFLGFVEPPLHIGAAEIGDFAEALDELRMKAIAKRSDEADAVAFGAALLELGDGAGNAEIAAPFDIGLTGNLAGKRDVVVILDEHLVARARR